MLAKGAGTTARSVGRARELEPGHRRDGIALALLGVAFLIELQFLGGRSKLKGYDVLSLMTY